MGTESYLCSPLSVTFSDLDLTQILSVIFHIAFHHMRETKTSVGYLVRSVLQRRRDRGPLCEYIPCKQGPVHCVN